MVNSWLCELLAARGSRRRITQPWANLFYQYCIDVSIGHLA